MTTPSIQPQFIPNQPFTLVIRKKPGKIARIGQRILGAAINIFCWGSGLKKAAKNLFSNNKALGAETLWRKGDSGTKIFAQHLSSKTAIERIEKHYVQQQVRYTQGSIKDGIKLIPKNAESPSQELVGLHYALGGEKDPETGKLKPIAIYDLKRDKEAAKPDKPTVLLSYGLGFHAPAYEYRNYLLNGIDVMLYHAPSIGLSEGPFKSDLFKEGIFACYDYLKENGVKDEELLVQGMCFGGGLAAHLASSYPNINLQLVHTATHSKHIYSPIVPFPLKGIVSRFMGLFNLKTKDSLKNFHGNLCVVKALHDTTVPSGDSDTIHHSVRKTAGKINKLIETDTEHLHHWHDKGFAKQHFDFLREIGFIG